MNTDELERLMREAMPAPWRLNEDGTISLASGAKAPWRQTDRANCALIVAAVNALPELLAKVKRLEEALNIFVDRPWMKCLSDDLSESHLISMDVRVADIRRASRALAALSAPTVSGLTEEERAEVAAVRERHEVEMRTAIQWTRDRAQVAHADRAAILAFLDAAAGDDGVEKVARAICETMMETGRTDWGGPVPAPDYYGAARAALSALKGEVKP